MGAPSESPGKEAPMPDQRHPTTEPLISTTEFTAPSTKLVWPEPRKKFSVIVADPPWDKDQKGRHGAGRHYNLMTLDSIMYMPVEDLAEKMHIFGYG